MFWRQTDNRKIDCNLCYNLCYHGAVRTYKVSYDVLRLLVLVKKKYFRILKPLNLHFYTARVFEKHFNISISILISHLIACLVSNGANFCKVFLDLHFLLAYHQPSLGKFVEPQLNFFLQCVYQVIILLFLLFILFKAGFPLALWKWKYDLRLRIYHERGVKSSRSSVKHFLYFCILHIERVGNRSYWTLRSRDKNDTMSKMLSLICG